MIMCILPGPSILRRGVDKLDPSTSGAGHSGSSPSRARAEEPRMVPAPHRPHPPESSSSPALAAGQKRHRSPHEAGHGPVQEAGVTPTPGGGIKHEAGGASSASYVTVTEASAVPWAPVEAEMKTQRSGTYSASSSPSLTHDTFSGNLELDTGRNSRPPPPHDINIFSPQQPAQGTLLPLHLLLQSCSCCPSLSARTLNNGYYNVLVSAHVFEFSSFVRKGNLLFTFLK
jgi:hypothetical protein